MRMEKYKYSDITEKIIGAAMRVHSYLGNGFQRVVYQRCLALELVKTGLEFLREVEMPIYYHEQRVGMRRADFVVEGKVLVELKAVVCIRTVIGKYKEAVFPKRRPLLKTVFSIFSGYWFSFKTACAAASRATGTRKGEQLT